MLTVFFSKKISVKNNHCEHLFLIFSPLSSSFPGFRIFEYADSFLKNDVVPLSISKIGIFSVPFCFRKQLSMKTQNAIKYS